MSGEGTDRYEYGPARRVTLSPGVERLVRAAAEVPRCATCRHWLPIVRRSVGVCDRLTSSTPHANAWIDDGGPHDDDSGEISTARMVTRSEFGCTEHEPAGRPPTEETEP